ncbi:MAG TPA: hypothetical protein PKW18_05390 [Candidatus Sumerlaeota bacterium]|nr:MAG: hypothetical protein BWY12_02646 [candidate division BRC1 bacterium ADurb.Bin183]HOE62535.1 hypothetical protein [Candidatus Sumerlaeota bacterium]HRR30572.1 hypothetical protein [Candidatus Sumerlaeia bacterium]HON50024.1 hypothetical protein [Candidatus Sumerlaeota bacterium]HOR63240.1 hypothetical protein [Candidatus Sumerlaeota bacterium]
MKLGCSYFGNRILKHVAEDMKYLADNHFTYVVHTFSENDFRFYAGTMKEIIRISKDCGLETLIDPWGVGRVFGGEAFSEFVAFHPEECQMLNDGKPSANACPNNPKFRTFMKNWIETAVGTGADYVFWDEPHFYLSSWMGGRPNTWGCRCKYCAKKFEEEYNMPMPLEETPTVNEFKHYSIRAFLQEMLNHAHQYGAKNSLCILPHSAANDVAMRDFAEMNNLEDFGTDPYWYGINKNAQQYVGETSRKVFEVCREVGRNGHIWIQGFKIPAGREKEIEIAVKAAVDAGIRNLAVWGFDACGNMSTIAPDDPKKAWQIILESFKSVKDLK